MHWKTLYKKWHQPFNKEITQDKIEQEGSSLYLEPLDVIQFQLAQLEGGFIDRDMVTSTILHKRDRIKNDGRPTAYTLLDQFVKDLITTKIPPVGERWIEDQPNATLHKLILLRGAELIGHDNSDLKHDLKWVRGDNTKGIPPTKFLWVTRETGSFFAQPYKEGDTYKPHGHLIDWWKASGPHGGNKDYHFYEVDIEQHGEVLCEVDIKRGYRFLAGLSEYDDIYWEGIIGK